jgi:exopolysaccharide biosynthesis polyprenyl glycosylphosphotransferase
MLGSADSPRSVAGTETMSATKPTAESRSFAGAPDGLREQDREARTVQRRAAPRRIRRGWLVRRALLAADVVGLLAAFFATELLFAGDHLVGGLGIGPQSAIFAASLAAWVVAAKLYGLYDRDEERATHSTADEVVNVFHLITVGVWFFYATSWLVGLSHPNQEKLTTFWLLAFLAVIGMRLAARALARRHPAFVQNTVIVGAGDVGQLIARKMLQHPEYRINLIGFADADPKQLRRDVGDVHVLGGLDDVIEVVRANDVDRVVVAFSHDREEQLLDLVRALRAHDVQIDVVPRLFDTVGPNSALHSIEGLPVLSVAPVRISRSSRLLKRCIDIVGASLLLVVTAPLLLAIAWLIRRDSPGPVLFRQTRLGMDMHRFTLLKFRTMHEGTDEAPHRKYLEQIMSAKALPVENNLYKLDRSGEVTRIGHWLRRTSLDELPQLLNVLRNDMSLVGPRPSIPYELELYAPHHMERFAVPAGLTGLWQVEARAHSTFREALDLDVAYARGWSLGLDLRLLLRTPLLMFRKRETG